MSYVAFDIGNVICDVDLNVFVNKLVELDILESTEDGMRVLNEIQHAQDIGLINLEGYLLDTLKVKRSLIPELMESWHSTVKPNNTMINLIDALENKGVNIAFLSNIGFEHMSMIRNEYGDFFNRHIQHFSCEVGARKPFKLYYQSFLFENPKFDHAIYLDDREENVKAAKSAGLQGHLFKLDELVQNDEVSSKFNQIMGGMWLSNNIKKFVE